MAFVAAGTTAMVLTFRDRDNNPSTCDFYVPAAAIVGDVETFARGALATNVSALSDAFLEAVTITRRFENDTVVQPAETSDVERKGVFVWQATDRTTSKNEIPSIKNTLVIDGSQTINTTDPLVTTFLAMMIDAGLIDVYGLGNYRGIKITGQKSAPHKIHRASSRG